MYRLTLMLFSAALSIEAGINADSFLNNHGILTAKTSGKDASTWNVREFTDYAKRGCSVKPMALGFKASRVGRVRVVQASMTTNEGKQGKKSSGSNGARMRARVSANFASRLSEGTSLPRLVTGAASLTLETGKLTGGKVASDIKDAMLLSSMLASKASRKLRDSQDSPFFKR